MPQHQLGISSRPGPIRSSKPARTSDKSHPYLRGLKSRFFSDPQEMQSVKNSVAHAPMNPSSTSKAVKSDDHTVTNKKVGMKSKYFLKQSSDTKSQIREKGIKSSTSGASVTSQSQCHVNDHTVTNKTAGMQSKYFLEQSSDPKSQIREKGIKISTSKVSVTSQSQFHPVESALVVRYTDDGRAFYPYFPSLVKTHPTKPDDALQTELSTVSGISKPSNPAKGKSKRIRKTTQKSTTQAPSVLNHTETIPDVGLRLVNAAVHMDRSVDMKERLAAIKPILIQEVLREEPAWVIIATILLNVTTGRAAIPVLYKIRKRWPTLYDLAQADDSELLELLIPLGLGNKRKKLLKEIASIYLMDPPSMNSLRKSRVQHEEGEPKYPATEISHLPNVGRYALDSYRIFCKREGKPDDWKKVMPKDKELRVYIRWRWAVEGYIWDSERGKVGPATLDYLNALCEGQLHPGCLLMQRA